MKVRSPLLLTLVCAIASTACQPPAQEAAGLSEEDAVAIKALLEANKQAGMAADWETFFTHFTDDAVIMWPNMPAVEGIEAIRAVSWVNAVEWELSIVEIDGVDDLAYLRGAYSLLLDYEGAVKEEGKFVNIVRRQPDGSWRFAAWINNLDQPLPETGM